MIHPVKEQERQKNVAPSHFLLFTPNNYRYGDTLNYTFMAEQLGHYIQISHMDEHTLSGLV